ncbi:unnamed protein product [Candidula unifasciata]|uniref:C2H2-type domain-containing protein n=1 Tax=Candidula unifasciata TaxID=100452 RepID=A0A8S3ZZ42_9EUPU|nr:unnamed protein product [Candidula unifasciata]
MVCVGSVVLNPTCVCGISGAEPYMLVLNPSCVHHGMCGISGAEPYMCTPWCVWEYGAEPYMCTPCVCGISGAEPYMCTPWCVWDQWSFHNGNFPVRCTVCSFSADSESKIKRHVATQHRPPNAGISNNGSLDRELNSQLDVPTDGAQVDQGKDKDPSDGGRLVEYRCPKCPMVCYRRGNFTRHLTAKHKINQTTAAALSKSIEGKIAKVLKRKRAGSAFTALKQMRFQAMENLKCSHCSYIAKWPSDLRRHMQVHTLIKRFKCSMCTNKYKYLGDLNVHMRRDHNTEPPDNIAREVATSDALTKASPAMFRCPVCPYASQSKAELEQHSRIHANTEKTYQCRQCDYQTYWRGDVSRHLFRHHKIVLSKEASEIWAYFLHRPDIKPLTKQGGAAAAAAAAAASLAVSPSSLPEVSPGKTTPQNTPAVLSSQDQQDSISYTQGSSRKSSPASGTVFLKEGSFICEYPNCDFKTTISDRMEIHLAVHQNLKMFVCPTCGKRTNWKWDVVKHMNKVHMNTTAVIEDVITLSIDQAKATIQDYLSSHEKKSKNLVVSYCSLCNFKSLDRNRVVRHLATVHKHENGTFLSMPMIRSESLENPLNIQTEEGGVSLDSDRFLLDGSGGELPVRKFVEPPAEELAQLEKPYACAICRKVGSTKGDVKKHYNYTHPYKDVRIVYVGDETEFNYYTGEIYQKSSKSDQSLLESPDMKTGMPPLSPSGKILRPDSKFSNPKMHGYVKPFKCSICGLRSNWKWDLKKHLRSKHPNQGGFVILLSIEEASETYGKDCTPSHPKNEDFLSPFSSSPSQVPLQTPSNPSPVPAADHVFKPPPNIKAEILEDSDGEDSQDELCSVSSFFSESSASSASPSPRPRGRESSTSLDPTRRQWRCSACNYISNWRRNMARHIHRKHPEEEETVEVLALHETPETVNDGTGEDVSQNREAMDVEARSYDTVAEPDVPEKKVSCVQSDMRLWNCSRCVYSSRLRTHIIVHMQQHEMKPFSCGICGMPFMNRGPLHRHLQKVHKRSDYLKLCKVNIQYNDEPGASNADEVTRNEYINSYFCRLCSLESLDRIQIVQHLIDVHDSPESDNNILKIQKHVGGSAKRRAALVRFSKNNSSQKWNKKVHFCTICPFRTLKKSMLAFHMTYHKPNSVNKFKCKYCPYYVGAVRLLHQHQRKWHKESSSQRQWEQEEQTTPTQSPTKLGAGSTSPLGTPRRHCCEKCPYTTNSKNDFIYHKQFHRPKRTAEFKCEYCDYWVVHKRLLKQHTRLHTTVSPSSGAVVENSPAKSLCSDPGLVYDPVELTELAAIKQKMISAKITASLSNSPNISPMKLASQCSVDSKPGYIIKNGLYRKLHKCQFCPYTNIRSRNMQLHEMMHGPRDSNCPLMKCPYCDYYVGSKGLLSHHMKVHQKTYGDTPENDAELGDLADSVDNDDESDQDIPQQQKVDTLLQISRFKRFGCERCPYASAKRQHFVRHLELHGSRQRHTCQYCDYSVPSNNLLHQHTKLHLMPNQNLLASQSITNLQHLSEVPADVALASALPPADSDTAVTISVIHDHLGLYENSIYDSEPKKLYRCDRCPYANVRRDYLLSHLKFHMVPSSLVCPYCDYSAPKQPLLTQHIRVHFCPLPELSDWLLENGQVERETSQKSLDLAEALKVAQEYQNKSKKKDKTKAAICHTDRLAGKLDEKPEGKENIQSCGAGDGRLIYICQYCDREFPASDKLVKHELQHLIGNHFEATECIDLASTHDRQQQQKQQQNLQADQPVESQCLENNNSQEDSQTEATMSSDRQHLCESGIVAAADGTGVRGEENGKTSQEVIGESVHDSGSMETGVSDTNNIQEDERAHESASSLTADVSASHEGVGGSDKEKSLTLAT